MPIPFEPTRSYIYRAARYELLPRIAEIARKFGDEPFLLREIAKPVLEETYTPEDTDGKLTTTLHSELSASDKEFIAKLYPKD